MIPHQHLYPTALPRAITEPSGGVFLFASFVGTMVIVAAFVVFVLRVAHDPGHMSPVLSDEDSDVNGDGAGDGTGDRTPTRD